MNKKKIHRTEKSREMKQTIRIGIMVVLVVFFLVSAFLNYYNTYLEGILYAERLNQMKEVTGQLFAGLEDVVNGWWEDTDRYCNFVEKEKPATAELLTAFLEEQASLNELDEKQADIIAVDNRGIYYSQNGRQGALAEMTYLLDAPERVCFISNAVTKNETKIYFLKKLKDPISIENAEKTIRLMYYGFACNMEELNPYFACESYGGINTVYVLDKNGEKLFAGKDEELLSGYNLFSVLGKMDYLHGSSLDEAREELSRNGVAYSNAMLNDTEYYYSIYQMKDAEWILLFLIPSDYVAVNTVQMMNTTIRVIMIFAVSLLVFCVMLVYWILRRRQKQEITVEREMNQRLELMNQKLETAVEKAESASKAKTDFLANMSHDIRTPMNAIVGITNLMEHEEGSSDKMHGYIEKVQLSSRHLLGLINDILDMSRIESKEVQLNVEKFNLMEQINQVDSIIRAQANEQHQKFHIHADEIIHEYLVGDGVRLRQILLNLLSNAVKYTPEGGEITLDFMEEACSLPDHARFICRVSDNGYGMSPEFVEHIFEPFTRAESSVTNKVQGTGLGMAITKNIVDLMGGEIHVESEPGKGSCFEVRLMFPVDEETPVSYDTGDLHQCTDESDFTLRGMRFLCAEDNTLNAEILKEILNMYEAECTIYSNGEEIVKAFEQVKAGDCDAILMDIRCR